MADWPSVVGGGNRVGIATAVATATSAAGVSVAASSTANTKGAWSQLVSATSSPCNQLSILMFSGSAYDHLVDIGIGPSGSEVILLPDLMFARANSTNTSNFSYTFPVKLPAGTRIAARSQCRSTANGIVRMQILLSDGGFYPEMAGIVAAYGATAATSGGVVVDPGAVVNTKGAWTQITSATAQGLKGIVIAVGQQAINSRTISNEWLLDIAVGAAGNETVVLSNYGLTGFADAFTTPQPAVSPLLPIAIPAGSRIAARIQASNVSNTIQRAPDIMIYGVA